MLRSKLGVSTNLLGAISFLLALLLVNGSLTALAIPFIVVVAYVLAKEEDLTLRIEAATSVVLVLSYYAINVVFGFIDEFLGFLNFFLQFAKIRIYDEFGITNFIFQFVIWAYKIILIILALMAFKGKTIKFGFITKHVN